MNLKTYYDLPGPYGLPLLGSILNLRSGNQGKILAKWAEKNYGNIFRLRIGSRQVLALQGYEAIKEALIEKSDAFSGRIECDVTDLLRNRKGLFFTNIGKQWKKWHDFASYNIPTTREASSKHIQAEIKYFHNFLEAKLDESVNIHRVMSLVMMNTVLQMCFSFRYDYDDPDAEQLLSLIYGSVTGSKFSGLLFLPWLKHFPSYQNYIAEVEERKKMEIKMIKQLIERRKKKINEDTVDLYACYQQHCSNSASDFANLGDNQPDEDEFSVFVSDLIFAGSTTTANQLLWVILLLLKNQQCIKPLLDELDAEIGDHFSMEKIRNLPFTKAVVYESQRLRPIAPTSSLHQTTKDTSIMGYKIPKNTAVIPNIWSVHTDENIWSPDPEIFRPQRHLDDGGNFRQSKFVFPYSAGSRRCVGEQLATMEIIAHVAAIFSKFEVRLARESYDIGSEGIPGSILKPESFNLVFIRRA